MEALPHRALVPIQKNVLIVIQYLRDLNQQDPASRTINPHGIRLKSVSATAAAFFS